jgi:glycosyltransferase involved in cell wall biosynthesis
MNVSVIVTTYNRPDALACVLRSLLAQTQLPHEIVIADDGSGPQTAHCIAKAKAQSPVPLHHVWQADEGFRAARARNRAVASASGDYLVFLDGDCLLRPSYIAAHGHLAEQGWFVAGNRVLLSEAFTQALLAPGAPLWHQATLRGWLGPALRGEINRWFALCSLPGQSWRKYAPKRWQGARTCNLGVWRADFEQVNGFDEAYCGWGHEDADLAIRLIQSGVSRKDGRNATTVLHLWHRENDRSGLPENEARLAALLQTAAQTKTPLRAQQGLDQHHRA